MSFAPIQKIFILAGESSGDYIGSSVMMGLKEFNKNNINFFGVGGPLMKEQGLKTIYEMNEFNIIGFINTIYNYKKLNNYINQITEIILEEKPNVIITIDTKGFSLALAKRIKKIFRINKFKCPLIHFVPPTIWAYGKSRIKKWKNLHDGLFCLFKNEEFIFNQHKVNCIYVGNPVIENFINFKKKNVNLKLLKKKYIQNSKKYLCLLFPGSRDSEINFILAEFINLIKYSKKNNNQIKWIIPTTKLQYSKIVKKIFFYGLSKEVDVIILEDNYDIMKCADVAIACSGTVTLELVLFNIPTIAVYKTHFLSALVGRIIVNFKNVILPNFILNQNLVPFLFQEKCNYKNINKLLYGYLNELEIKKEFFKIGSNKILRNMNYQNQKKPNFSICSSQKIIKIINNFNQ